MQQHAIFVLFWFQEEFLSPAGYQGMASQSSAHSTIRSSTGTEVDNAKLLNGNMDLPN